MESSYQNPSYAQRYAAFSSPRHPCPSPTPPHSQSYSGNPNFYAGSDHSFYRQNHHYYPNRHDLQPPPPPPPPPVVNLSPSYYFPKPPPPPLPPQHVQYKPPQFAYDSPRMSQPSSSFAGKDSRDISLSAAVGYRETRPDLWAASSGSGRNYQIDYGRLSRDYYGERAGHGLNSNSRFSDGCSSLGFVRGEFWSARIEENYQSRGQLRSDSDTASGVLGAGNRGSSLNFCYGYNQYGAALDRDAVRNSSSDGGAAHHRWAVDSHVPIEGRALSSQKNDDYYRSEIEQYFHCGRRENGDDLNRTPRKQMQKKSVLLRLESPRPSQRSRDNNRSRHHIEKKSSLFRYKDQSGHSDRGFVKKQRVETPMELDVSFKSNALVGKAKVTPSRAGVGSHPCVTPRSSKVRRVLVTDKDDKALLSDGIAKGDIKSYFTDKGSSSDKACSQPKSEDLVSGVEKKSDSCLNPSSNVSEDEGEKDMSVEAVVSDCSVKIADKDVEISLGHTAAKADSPIHFAEKQPCLSDEVEKESKDEFDGKHLSNPGEIAADRDIGINKSHQETVPDWKGTSSCTGGIFLPVVLKKRTMKNMMKQIFRFPPRSLESQPTDSEKLSKIPEGSVPFAGLSSMRIVGSQPCTDEASKSEEKDISSTHLLTEETNIGFEGNTSTSPLRSSDHREKELAKLFTEATILSSREDAADQLHAKSNMSNASSMEDGGKGIHRKGGSLFPVMDSRGDSPKDLSPPERSEECSNSILEPTCLSERLANANCLNVETDSTFGIERANFVPGQTCGNGVGPSVESGGGKGSSESTYCNAEETDGNLCCDAGKQVCVSDVSSSPKNVAMEGNDGDLLNTCKNGQSLSSRLDLAKAISSEMCMEFASMDSSVHNQDVNLNSYHPGNFRAACLDSSVHNQDVNLNSYHPGNSRADCLDPFIDVVTVLDGGPKACFTESTVLLGEDTNVGHGDTLLERDVMETVPSTCNKFPSSQALEIVNSLAAGGMDKSGSETILDYNCYPSGTQFSEGCQVLHENYLGCGSSDAVVSVRDSSMDNCLTEDNSRVNCCSVPDNSATQSHLSSLEPVTEQIQNATSVQAKSGESHDNAIDKGSGQVEISVMDSQEENLKLSTETSKLRTPDIGVSIFSGDSNVPCDFFSGPPQPRIGHMQNGTPVIDGGNERASTQASENEDQLLAAPQEQIRTLPEPTELGSSLEHLPCSVQTSPGTDVESDETRGSNYFALLDYPVVGSSEKLNEDRMENSPDVPSDVCSPESALNIATTGTLDGEALHIVTFDEKVSGTSCLVSSDLPHSASRLHADVKHAYGHAEGHLVSVAALASNNKTKAMHSMGEKTQAGKNTFNYVVHKSYSRSPFPFAAKRNVNLPTHITKPHTWYRKGDTSAFSSAAARPLFSGLSTQQKLPKAAVEAKGTYIRRGNSLLRKPANGMVDGVSLFSSSSTDQLNCLAVDDTENLGSDRRIDANDAPIVVRMGETHTTEGQPLLPPNSVAKVSSSIATSSEKYMLSPSRDSLANGLPELKTDFVKSGEANVPLSSEDGLKTSESDNRTAYDLNCQRKEPPPNLASSNPLKITYVKRKSNQLVAASDIHSAGGNRVPPSDGYFKRRKNQLVRTSDGQVKPAVLSSNDAINAQALAAPETASKRKFTSVCPDIAVGKPFKHSKFSLVWTLNDTQSRKTSKVHMQYQKILPQLFPWKRVPYWRRLMNSASVSRRSSFSTISQKLLLLRKRHTVYTRSNNGYSLRKSKVLSIGGSHLKWSKSIERNSKKANEEATLAVAAFAKRKRENHLRLVITGTKNKNHAARERIFRIGFVRYKMDPSRRTLQRIFDDESPYSGPPQSGKDAKKSFIPRRLVIGNDEYVRVGNGNQLVRDPKKRTRVLANEKVRWSLHNARLRFAKKRKYCQFFTRFGKCNKDDGKCPYIHDPSKVAVCTKFLNGLCATPNCKLTHKVIPERMPDCSYFLQGLCNNEACPYRHVHVNQNAATCKGFLRGYCADGNECREKHTYTCPVFEATGSCPQGSKCKLHHPKKRSKGKKRKRPCEPLQKNARGRYFGSLHNSLPDSEPLLLNGHTVGSSVFGGEAPDFISLDVSEDEAGESNDTAAEQSVSGYGDALDLLDEKIKPVRLMQDHAATAS